MARILLATLLLSALAGCGGDGKQATDMSAAEDLSVAHDLSVAQDLTQTGSDGGTFGCGIVPPWLSCETGRQYCSEVDTVELDGGTPTASCVPIPSSCSGMSVCDCLWPTIPCNGAKFCSESGGVVVISCTPSG